MKGIIMNVIHSTTRLQKPEKITDKELQAQWKSIDWVEAENFVNRIQVRIVKAVKEDKWNLVKRLQYLLTHSFYAKAVAIKRVTSSKGKNTPGVDGITWSTDADKMRALYLITTKQYKCKPLKRVYIEKYGKNEKRPLGIPTIMDRAMQALYLTALEPVSEVKAEEFSFGFRKCRSAHDAMSHIFNILAPKKSATWILEGDIKGCFENIRHEWLLKNIPMDKDILNKFLSAGFIANKQLFPTLSGTPQGGVISPTLSNMTLDGMLRAIAEKYWMNSKGNIDKKHKNDKKINFVRYADDFIVTATNKETLLEVQQLIEDFLEVRGLTLSKEKTIITNIQDGFDFLGWNFRKRPVKLIIQPSTKSFSKIIRSLSDVIRTNKASSQGKLIQLLNLRIRGWCNYHQPVCSKYHFKKLNNILWNMLWGWSKRRHPNKGRKWVAKKYWERIAKRSWVFTDGENRLINAGDIPIVRHIALKLDKLPLLDNEYFEKRALRQKKIKQIAYIQTTAAQIFN